MIRHVLFTCLLWVTPLSGTSQYSVVLHGTVTSLNGETLPKAHLLIEPVNNSLLFNSQNVEGNPDGQFAARISREGIYHVTVHGVLHKSTRLPIWIRGQDSLQLNIELDPKNLDDGQYFNSNEYLSWIRATGNFNGYNFDKGTRFSRVDSTTLQAEISTSLDTIRYQIVGLTSGTMVLPGADDYDLRNYSDYEGLVAVKNNGVILTYKADSTYYPNQNPYEGYRTTWDPDQTEYRFSNSLEDKIHKNLDSGTYFPYRFDYRIFDSDSLPEDQYDSLMDRALTEQKEIRIRVLKNVEKELAKVEASALLQSLYIKYLYILSGLISSNREILVIPGEDFDLLKYTDEAKLLASMKHISPASPLWSLHSSLVNTYPQILGHTQRVVNYLEKVVLQHPDDRVAGPLLFRLFSWSYDTTGNSDRSKKYYQYILERFGNDYYARKAREYVEKRE